MKSWRLGCLFKWIFSKRNHIQQRAILKNLISYYFALLTKLIPGLYKPPIRFILKAGGVFEVHYFMTIYIYHEIFIDGCYDLKLENCNNKVRIIDVGANTGLFALRAKQMWPNSLIHCYEPYPPNYKQLQRNLKLSKLNGIKTFCKGVSDVQGVSKLYIHPKNIGGHSLHSDLSGNESVNIELVDLESALNELDGYKCEVLKLDCEGAEHEILKSINKKNAPKIKCIIFEKTWGIYSLKELVKHLTDCGYSVSENKNNLIVAIYNEI